MKKAFQHGLLSLATLILLLHSFFPHSHQEVEKNDESLISVGCHHLEHSLSDIFEDILAQDVGVDHLEHFVHGETATFQNVAIVSFALFFFYKKRSYATEKTTFPKEITYHFLEHFPQSEFLRGPPQV